MKRTFLEWLAEHRYSFLVALFTFAAGLAIVGPQPAGTWSPPVPVVNAGPDRTVLVNEPLSLDGSASTEAFDGWRVNSDQHAITWDFGYGGWTYMGGLIAPVAYPQAGVYTVTLTVCNSSDVCSSDIAIVTVNAIPEGTVTTVADTGNPVTNGINLCNAIASRATENHPVIEVVAGVIYRRPPTSACTLPNRTGAGYLTVRTTAHQLLPGGTSRVFPADASRMAIIETGVHHADPNQNSAEAIFRANSQTSPGHHYRFIGLHFRKTFPTLGYSNPRGFFDIGNGSATSLSQLPHHLQIDRCFFDGGSTTSATTRGVALIASDTAIVNNYMYRIKGLGIEVQAVFVGMGERIAFINNYLQASSENFIAGGADPTITGHVPTDMVFRRNHMQKDVCWLIDNPCYYGTNMVVKNIFEIKIGNRISVQGNVFEDHWMEDQNWAITITVRNQAGKAPWSDISFLDFAHNKVLKVGNGVQVLGSDDLNPSQTIDHITFRHVIFAGLSFYNGRHNPFVITSAGGAGGDRISIVRVSSDGNGFDGQGRFIEFDVSTGFTNCKVLGVVGQGYFNAAGFTGTSALQRACSTSSFEVVKNGFFNSVGINPSGNSTVATRADVKYTNIPGFNLKLAGDSPFLTTGLGGGRAGADTDTVDQLTSGVVTGVWTAGSICRWATIPACQSQ